jgi:hypothetical protein
VQTSEALAKLYSTCKSEGIACFVLGNDAGIIGAAFLGKSVKNI